MYRSILVPLDLDHLEDCAEALAAASALAGCFSAQLTICSIVSSAEAIRAGDWLPISIEQRLFDARARLEGVAAAAPDAGSWGVEVAAGTICGGVLEIAEKIAADLIVMTSHLPAIRDHLWAANAVRVARRAPCSVMIARKGRA